MSDRFLFLHGLAIKKFGTPSTVATILGTDESETRFGLEQAVKNGEAAIVRGTFVLTTKGHEELKSQYPVQFRQARESALLSAAYQRFEIVNVQLKKLMTDWQTIDIAGELLPNDHSDSEYDERLIGRLEELHERFKEILPHFVEVSSRLKCYGERLNTALLKIEDDNYEYVSGVKVDSYHTVWFELHEDLLRILERVRHE
jgi:hypothetical protein